MKVLVTGGAGYIGSHTCKALANAGFSPVIIDNCSMGHAHNVRWGAFVQADLSDRNALHGVFDQHKIEAVIHLAGSAVVTESMRYPRRYFGNNSVVTAHLLDAMLNHGVRSIIFSSTSSTYGLAEWIPITEEHPQRPLSPYGESKLFIERMLYWLGEREDLSWIALRYFNAAGADPDGELGEEHDPETHLIPKVLLAAMEPAPCVEIYGTDYETPDGTAVRDYTHVTDLADAHVLAVRRLLDCGEKMAINLGSGNGSSVRQVIAMAEQVSGRNIRVREVPHRPGDPPVLVADCTRANRVLSWRPRLSDLATIVGTAWKWHSRQESQNRRPKALGAGSL